MKVLVVSLLTIASLNAFGMGNTDTSKIQSVLDDAAKNGYECNEKWPDNFYLSDVPHNGKYELAVNCTKKGELAKTGIIEYQVVANAGSRCPDSLALSIKINN